MRFFFLFFLALSFCAAADTYPPSPAGGGHFQIYNESNYVFAPDHDDFDRNLQKKGFTIEMWIYLTRPLRLLDKELGSELWTLIEKKGSYGLKIRHSYAPSFSFTHPIDDFSHLFMPHGTIDVKRWHYIAVMLSDTYVQQVVDTRLRGTKILDLRRRNIEDLLNFETSASSLQIGGGMPPVIGVLPGPLEGKPIVSNFTGGLIDEVRISNIVRYPWAQLDKGAWKAEIKMPTGPFKPDRHTVALWHFDFDGTGGSRWRDASGNGHHLTYRGHFLGVDPEEKLAVTWGELKRQ